MLRIDLRHEDEGAIITTNHFQIAWCGKRYVTPFFGKAEPDAFWECIYANAFYLGPFILFWGRELEK